MNIHDLEYRMYGLVPYNLSDIQKGIQFGHAVVEYMMEFTPSTDVLDSTGKWASEDKTFIILNGGTTNRDIRSQGTMNKHLDELLNNRIEFSTFYEPDLGNQLTAICFLVDERVFNREKYPDFELDIPLSGFPDFLGGRTEEEQYDEWVKQFEFTGWRDKTQVLFLREYLPKFNLA